MDNKSADPLGLGPTRSRNAVLFRPLVSVVVGLSLVVVGLGISIFTSLTIVGVLLGIPFVIAGIAVPVMTISNSYRSRDVKAACPNCGAPVETEAHIREFACPACHQRLEVAGGRLLRAG